MSGTIAINIYDVTGRVVSSQQLDAAKGLNTYTLNTTDLQKGIYILSLDNQGSRLIEKLIIDK
jgi:hypothetical protein